MSRGDGTGLGDRMKRYENVTRRSLPRRTFAVIRVDGRAFHSFLRGAQRPYDLNVMAAMDEVGRALVKEISGAVLGFVQSDEASVVVQDFGSLEQEPWFGGVEAKMISISASVATAAFKKRYGGERLALFDSRVWTLPDPVEVANYLVWRQRDAIRNSIMMTAQTWISHNKLHGLNTDQVKELLKGEHGVNWDDQPQGFRQGRVVTTGGGLRLGDPLVTPAPLFEAKPGSWLAGQLPEMAGFQ